MAVPGPARPRSTRPQPPAVPPAARRGSEPSTDVRRFCRFVPFCFLMTAALTGARRPVVAASGPCAYLLLQDASRGPAPVFRGDVGRLGRRGGEVPSVVWALLLRGVQRGAASSRPARRLSTLLTAAFTARSVSFRRSPTYLSFFFFFGLHFGGRIQEILSLTKPNSCPTPHAHEPVLPGECSSRPAPSQAGHPRRGGRRPRAAGATRVSFRTEVPAGLITFLALGFAL